MKIKPLKVMTYLFLLLAFSILPLANASAIATEDVYWGYSVANPHTHYFSDSPYAQDFWVQGSYWFDGYAFDTYGGVNFYKMNFNGTSNNDVNTPAYAGGRQVVYVLTRNCAPTGANSTVNNHWVLESMNSEQVNYIDKYQYTSTDNGVRGLYQFVFRNNTDDTTIPAHIPISMYCTTYQGSSISPEKPMINVVAVGIYGQYPYENYHQDLQDIKDAIENGQDAGQVLQQQREEDRQDMEDAQGDADDAGQDAGQAVTEETGDMINLVGGIIGAITDTNATNCNVTANWGNLNLGQLNLCSAPQEIRAVLQTVLGVIGVIVVLNTVHYLVDTIYNMTKEVQDT